MLKKPTIITSFIICFYSSLPCFAQKICSDTTVRDRFYLSADSSLSIYGNFTQSNGNSYFLGRSWKNSAPVFSAVISKKDQWGNFLWSKNYTAENDSSLILSNITELTDETIIAFGTIQSSLPFHESEKPLLLHLSNDGNIISCWRIDLKEASKINGFFRSFLCQTDIGSIALLINYSTEDVTSSFVVMNLDIASGSCIWTNKFYKNNFFYTTGMVTSGNELIISNNFSNGNSSSRRNGINLIKISSLTGSLVTGKSYENIFQNTLPTLDNFGKLRMIGNGNLKLIYSTSKDNEPNKIVGACMNNNLSIISTKAIGNIADNYLVRNYSINNSGSFVFSFFNSTNPNDQGYIAVDSSEKIIQQRKIAPSAGTDFSVVYSNNDINLSDDNKLTLFTEVNRNSKIEMESISTRIYNTDSDCIGHNFHEAIAENYSLQTSAWALDQGSSILSEFIPSAVSSNNLFIQQQRLCLSEKEYAINLPDTVSKCNNDTVILKASPDFTFYNWQPNSYSDSVKDSILKVFPPFTLNYSVSAQTYWGCIVKDTAKVIVNKSTPIHLPNDTSFCEGTDLILDAGKSFISYLWNDGTTWSYKKVLSAGQYIVEAIDSNHCTSRDSFQLINRYPRPYLNIHQKQILCSGQNDVLNPGQFVSYLWQDGSKTQTYSVQYTGTYWVKVTNENNCENVDTVKITTIANPPTNFIESDTSICNNETILLKPFHSYDSYQWNDGSSLPYMEVHQSGNYSLKVTDNNGCTGKQMIVVDPKNCTNVLIFPSAFTPNQDGLNDYFKPFIRGSFDEFDLSIFNRWGQKVFSTSNPFKGWDGTFGGKEQEGVFVWSCAYKFKGEKAKVQKGTLALIR